MKICQNLGLEAYFFFFHVPSNHGLNHEVFPLNHRVWQFYSWFICKTPYVKHGGLKEKLYGLIEQIHGLNDEHHGLDEKLYGFNEKLYGVNEKFHDETWFK